MQKKDKVHIKATFLRDAVFAASDGIVTTFAIVAGSIGASFSSEVVLVLGFANLFADGFSMAAGNFLGVKSEMEFEVAEGNKIKPEAKPLVHGLVTFFAFNIAGLLPLLPFVLGFDSPFHLSTFFVILAMFTVGSIRAIFTKRAWYKSGIEMLFVGGFAAFVAFTVGFFIDSYVL